MKALISCSSSSKNSGLLATISCGMKHMPLRDLNTLLPSKVNLTAQCREPCRLVLVPRRRIECLMLSSPIVQTALGGFIVELVADAWATIATV